MNMPKKGIFYYFDLPYCTPFFVNYTLNYNFEANKKIVKKSTKKPSSATRTIIAIQSIQSKEVINYLVPLKMGHFKRR